MCSVVRPSQMKYIDRSRSNTGGSAVVAQGLLVHKGKRTNPAVPT